MPQVDFRSRCISKNFGLASDAECSSAETTAGGISARSRVREALSSACTTGGSGGWIAVADDLRGAIGVPLVTVRLAAFASRAASPGLNRSSIDRYAHWSVYGSRVPGSRKTV